MADYNERVRQLFGTTAHAGRAPGPRVLLERGTRRVELSAVLDGQRLTRLAFRVYGCPYSIAAAEAFCAAFEGRGAADLAGFDPQTLIDDLALPVEKTGQILLLEDAIHALARECGAQRD